MVIISRENAHYWLWGLIFGTIFMVYAIFSLISIDIELAVVLIVFAYFILSTFIAYLLSNYLDVNKPYVEVCYYGLTIIVVTTPVLLAKFAPETGRSLPAYPFIMLIPWLISAYIVKRDMITKNLIQVD